ncbi:MAG: hypothetical protein GY862_22440 [Gammaproteobacteria bacterium]|nr:hypothetical protein [Gammaproteobacteria bacterium]
MTNGLYLALKWKPVLTSKHGENIVKKNGAPKIYLLLLLLLSVSAVCAAQPPGNVPLQAGRNIIVAIDAGHGGVDPGASGRYGTREKTVALAIARDLAALVKNARGMESVLIRDGDYFLSLRERIKLARNYQADLFISIHADALRDTSSEGASVYMLSQSGASSEAARWLAERENRADLLGGVSLNDKDDVLASVLLNLSQYGTLEASAYLGDKILRALGDVGSIHYRSVQQAAFMVLRSPDIPSILVETAFISNPREEKKLSDPSYRRRIAAAILQGTRAYFIKYAPRGTWLARQ